MKTVLAMLAAAMVLILTIVWAGESARSSSAPVDARGEEEVVVVLTDAGFEPQHVQVSRGTIVTFTTNRKNQFWPASNLHPSHTIYPEFDPGRPIAASSSWSFTPREGVWGYHDHVRSYFTGTLYVE